MPAWGHGYRASRLAPALPGSSHQADGVRRNFPGARHEYEPLRDALGKLQLNDAAFFTSRKTLWRLASFPLRLLGLLHLEIVQERLEREFGLNLITMRPVCVTHHARNRRSDEVDSPAKFRIPANRKIEEPMIKAMIITNDDSVGESCSSARNKRGTQKISNISRPPRVMLTYELPLNEMCSISTTG